MNRPDGCRYNCPGCRYIDLPYEKSLKLKFQFLQKNLKKWEDKIHDIRFSESKILKYRKKVILNVKFEDLWVFGMVVKDNVLDISSCPIHHDIVTKTINLFKKILPPYQQFPLHFYLQYDRQVALILKTKEKNDCEWMKDYYSEFEKIGLDGIWVHHNPSAGKRIFEKTPLYLVYGKEYSMNELNFYYSIGAFQQLIPKLYFDSLNETKIFFNNNDDYNIVDLYSGAGTSLKLWSSFTDVVGVELNGMSYKMALLNAPLATILRGKCSERLPQINLWIDKHNNKKINLFVNPPRIGIEKEVVDWILSTEKIYKIAYLSCSPGTLLRDLEKLSQKYKIYKIIPYDFFPFTHHIETLVLMKKL